MKRPSSLDPTLLLSLGAVLGLVLASAGLWRGGGRLDSLVMRGLVLVYLTGGLPTASRALRALWNERVLDIDLLMVVAAATAVERPTRARSC